MQIVECRFLAPNRYNMEQIPKKSITTLYYHQCWWCNDHLQRKHWRGMVICKYSRWCILSRGSYDTGENKRRLVSKSSSGHTSQIADRMIKSGYITTSTDPTFLISKSFPSCHSYSPTHPLYTDTPTPPLTPQSNTWEAIFCHASLNKAVDLAYMGGLTEGCVPRFLPWYKNRGTVGVSSDYAAFPSLTVFSF